MKKIHKNQLCVCMLLSVCAYMVDSVYGFIFFTNAYKVKNLMGNMRVLLLYVFFFFPESAR